MSSLAVARASPLTVAFRNSSTTRQVYLISAPSRSPVPTRTLVSRIDGNIESIGHHRKRGEITVVHLAQIDEQTLGMHKTA